MPWYIDVNGRHHAPGTPYQGDQQPGDPVAPSDPPSPDMLWINNAWTKPTTPASWVNLLDWAAENVPVTDLWALQTSMYGSFLNTAAMTGNWGAPDGSTTGAAYWYAQLKADVAASPSKYTSTTETTLTAIAAQFGAFGVPITP